jgi:excisionase family DNA binding protein
VQGGAKSVWWVEIGSLLGFSYRSQRFCSQAERFCFSYERFCSTGKANCGLIDTRELGRRLRVSKGTVENWRKQGLLPFIQLGRSIRFDWPTVHEALMRKQRAEH